MKGNSNIKNDNNTRKTEQVGSLIHVYSSLIGV